MVQLIRERVTEPSAADEPVSVALFAEHARLDLPLAEPLVVPMYISAARGYAERFCNRAWAPGTFIARASDCRYAYDPLYIMEPAPLEVTSVVVTDRDGTDTTVPPGEITWSQTLRRLYVRYGSISLRGPDVMTVNYTIGSVSVPPAVVACIAMVAADMYERRTLELQGSTYTNHTAERLLWMYRVGLGI